MSPVQTKAHACVRRRAAETHAWIDGVESEQDSGDRPSDTPRATVTSICRMLRSKPALPGSRQVGSRRHRTARVLTTTPSAPPNLEHTVSLYERLPHAGTFASDIHHLLRTACDGSLARAYPSHQSYFRFFFFLKKRLSHTQTHTHTRRRYLP